MGDTSIEWTDKTGTREVWFVVGTYVKDFATREAAQAMSVRAFKAWIEHPAQSKQRCLVEVGLRGKNLACWCPLPEPGQPDICHATVLLEIANS